MLMEEEPGATPPPSGGDTPPATPPAAVPITLEIASKFVTENGGFAFANAESLNTHIGKSTLLSDAKTSTYGKVDTNIEKIFGVKRNENEINEDYLKRSADAFKEKSIADASNTDNAEINAAKGVAQKANLKVEELEGTITKMKHDAFLGGVNTQIEASYGQANLAYSGIELMGVKRELNHQINSRFEFKQDEKGILVIDKTTGGAMLGQDGSRKTPEAVALEMIKGTQGLKFGDGVTPPPGGSDLPPGGGSPGGGLNEAETKVIEEKLNKWASEGGIYAHTKPYWIEAKRLGLEVPEHLVKQWKL
jgi:hypothetical protein